MNKISKLTYLSYLPEVVKFLETEEDIGKDGPCCEPVGQCPRLQVSMGVLAALSLVTSEGDILILR